MKHKVIRHSGLILHWLVALMVYLLVIGKLPKVFIDERRNFENETFVFITWWDPGLHGFTWPGLAQHCG